MTDTNYLSADLDFSVVKEKLQPAAMPILSLYDLTWLFAGVGTFSFYLDLF